MTAPNTFLIANAVLIEEESREHRRQLHREAEQHRLERLSQNGHPSWQTRARQRLGGMLIDLGSRLTNDEPGRVYMSNTNLSAL